jgi:hypothetical protein
VRYRLPITATGSGHSSGCVISMEALEYILSIYNVDTSGEMPIQLPISRERELPALFCELGYAIGAEIGVEQGKYSETLCKAIPDLRLYSIDPWIAYDRGSHVIPQRKLDRYYAEAVERLKPYNCEIVKRYSLDMARKLRPGTLDFVYIDGNHEFEYIIQDIIQWSKIVRSGGIISGHDWCIDIKGRLPFHVIQATRVYTEVYDIRPWFKTADHAPSWFWIKP